MKWTARTGVTPGTIGSSVNGALTVAPTVALNAWIALRPPGSVALTRIVGSPSPTPVSVKREPTASTATTEGTEDDAVKAKASPSGSTNAWATST